MPDGDTGTNMSLTLESVVASLAKLPIGASAAEIRKAITTGALMGARGNSGVITSQILRGLCEGSNGFDAVSAESIESALAKAQDVAFHAVRKPVEGTILTVLKDSAAAAKYARKKKMSADEALSHVVEQAYASVQRTPELLPVLKENGVVDSGGYGLAILIDGFVAALTGKEGPLVDELAFARDAAPKVEIEQINDWEGSEFTYCNEFLVDSDVLDKAEALDFLATMGDCELCVGETPKFKVHVHSTRPTRCWRTSSSAARFPVFIHNMKLQSRRTEARGRAARGAQAARVRGRRRRQGQRQDLGVARRRRRRLRRSDHEPLHEGPARCRRQGQRRRGYLPSEQQEHHHGRPVRLRAVRHPGGRRAHQVRAAGLRRHVRRGRRGIPRG